MKNIIICCDGTWNTIDQKDEGVLSPTNVVQLYNSLSEKDDTGIVQHKYYHPGVGTNGTWWNKIIEGGTGVGLDQNIKSAYRELCDHYESGDKIFLFGFSRGSYTVRSLAGLMNHSGLLNIDGLNESEVWNRIDRVFNKGYRRKIENVKVWNQLGWQFKSNNGDPIQIWFIGVWDTVGALGIPDNLGLLNLIDNLHDYTFHDTDLSPIVQHARHALALDEMRASFQPTLWTKTNRNTKQIWFSGVHSDIGGGYKENGLSQITLKWMIEEAEQCGLIFNPDFLSQIKLDHQDTLHNSNTGIFSIFPTQPRSTPKIDAKDIHTLARQRHKTPPIKQSPYRQIKEIPTTLEIFAIDAWNTTGIWLEVGKTYTFTATGEWMDSSIKCGPAGAKDGNFQFGEVAQITGSLLGKAEELFKKITGNNSADFKFTRRHEDMDWFCLVGAIANGSGVDAKGHCATHETFLIGDGCTYTPQHSGYLYAYANDAWNCYENNRGHIKLQIQIKK